MGSRPTFKEGIMNEVPTDLADRLETTSRWRGSIAPGVMRSGSLGLDNYSSRIVYERP
jgi:hypothetical protein